MIVDSSYIFKAFKEGKVEDILDSKTLDLAFYEVGNIIWKHYTLLEEIREEEKEELIELLDMIENEVDLRKAEMRETMKIAQQKEIAFYDASFIFLARIHGEKLATLDKQLRKKCEKVDTLAGDF